jgi:hypothetical protein
MKKLARTISGVTPVACTSPRSGTDIFPSGLTGTVMLNSWFPQTDICRTSSSPMTYSAAAAVMHDAKRRITTPRKHALVLIMTPILLPFQKA